MEPLVETGGLYWLAVLAIVVFVIWRWAVERGPAPTVREHVGPGQALRKVLVLDIPGTESVTGSPDFVRAFGLTVAHLLDIRQVCGPLTMATAPPAVQELLAGLQERGSVRGPDIAQFVSSKRALGEGEAVTFVLRAPPGPGSVAEIVAFVTDAKSSPISAGA